MNMNEAIQFINNLADLFFSIAQSVEFIAAQFNKMFKTSVDDLSSDDSSDVTPHIKHLAFYSKKFRVRKKNNKRLWKRQKIP